MTCDFRQPVAFYQISYRCLLSVKTKNLITAGRCISVANSAWDITRVIPTCAVTGEAAGVAAAMSAQTGKELRHLDPGRLQARLKEHGVIIEDPNR